MNTKPLLSAIILSCNAVAECYSVWRGKELLYEQDKSPIDLSEQISVGVKRKFGSGAHMVMTPEHCNQTKSSGYEIEMWNEPRMVERNPTTIYSPVTNIVLPQTYSYPYWNRWELRELLREHHSGHRSFDRSYTPIRSNNFLSIPSKKLK